MGGERAWGVWRGWRWVRAAAAVLTVVVVMVLSSVVSAGWAVVRATPEGSSPPADAVVVFAGEERREQVALELIDGGVAPVVVVSHGTDSELWADRCGTSDPVEVLCATPDPSNTAGEAQMFADIAAERGWGSLLAVTGNYHLARARTLMTRCFDGTVRFAVVDWDDVPLRVTVSETAKLWVTRHLTGSSCAE